MNEEQFRERVELDQALADYIDEVAQNADSDQSHRGIGLELIFGAAAYALYRLAKNYFDHQRGLQEAELRELMLDQVEALVEKGMASDQAFETVGKISNEIASLRPDSSTLKEAIALLRGAHSSGAT